MWTEGQQARTEMSYVEYQATKSLYTHLYQHNTLVPLKLKKEEKRERGDDSRRGQKKVRKAMRKRREERRRRREKSKEIKKEGQD